MFSLEILKKNVGEKVFWVDQENVLSACGYEVCSRQENGKKKNVGRVTVSFLRSYISHCRVVKHGARLGLHNLLILRDGSMLASCNKKLLLKSPVSENFRVVHNLRFGNKPCLKGICIDGNGFIYYGEYSSSRKRENPVAVFRSIDNGNSFEIISEFAPGEVRHIHFIQWDRFGQCLWMGTGDQENECKILCSDNDGKSWNLVGFGSQLWRSVGLMFTEKYIYWGTDSGGSYAGTWKSRVVRMNRETRQIEEVFFLPGPCHGSAILKNGLMVIGTGIEKGANEVDGKAHIFVSRDGVSWHDVASWSKDNFPLIISFGLIHFPHGLENSELLHFTALGLSGYGEVYCVAKIREVIC